MISFEKLPPVGELLHISDQNSKGQIRSEWIHEVIDFPNYRHIYSKNFCPESLFEIKIKSSTNNFEYLSTYGKPSLDMQNNPNQVKWSCV